MWLSHYAEPHSIRGVTDKMTLSMPSRTRPHDKTQAASRRKAASKQQPSSLLTLVDERFTFHLGFGKVALLREGGGWVLELWPKWRFVCESILERGEGGIARVATSVPVVVGEATTRLSARLAS